MRKYSKVLRLGKNDIIDNVNSLNLDVDNILTYFESVFGNECDLLYDVYDNIPETHHPSRHETPVVDVGFFVSVAIIIQMIELLPTPRNTLELKRWNRLANRLWVSPIVNVNVFGWALKREAR